MGHTGAANPRHGGLKHDKEHGMLVTTPLPPAFQATLSGGFVREMIPAGQKTDAPGYRDDFSVKGRVL